MAYLSVHLYFMMFSMYLILPVIYYLFSILPVWRDMLSTLRVTICASTTQTSSTSLLKSLPIMLDILMVRSLFLSKLSLLVSPLLVPWISPYGIVGALISTSMIWSTCTPTTLSQAWSFALHHHNIPKTATHRTSLLSLVHSDLKGPLPVQTLEG